MDDRRIISVSINPKFLKKVAFSFIVGTVMDK